MITYCQISSASFLYGKSFTRSFPIREPITARKLCRVGKGQRFDADGIKHDVIRKPPSKDTLHNREERLRLL